MRLRNGLTVRPSRIIPCRYGRSRAGWYIEVIGSEDLMHWNFEDYISMINFLDTEKIFMLHVRQDKVFTAIKTTHSRKSPKPFTQVWSIDEVLNNERYINWNFVSLSYICRMYETGITFVIKDGKITEAIYKLLC